MLTQVLSITANKDGKGFKVTLVEPTGLVLKYFTYWPESEKLSAPRLKLGKFYKPAAEMPFPWQQIVIQQIKDYLEQCGNTVEAPEAVEPDSPEPETPKGGQAIPQAIPEEKPVIWHAIRRENGTFVKRHRLEDREKWSPVVEITEAECHKLQLSDLPQVTEAVGG